MKYLPTYIHKSIMKGIYYFLLLLSLNSCDNELNTKISSEQIIDSLKIELNNAQKEIESLELELEKELKQDELKIASVQLTDSLELKTNIIDNETDLQNIDPIRTDTLKQSFKNENFHSFFWKFMTDSIFQLDRVKFPMEYITWKEYIGGEIDTIKIQKTEWEHDTFYINTASERTQIYDNFNLSFRPSNERLLHWYGVESGGDAKYYFSGYNGKWYLIKKVQLGD